MHRLEVGSIVTRNSYGGDVHFKITNIVTNDSRKPVFTLKGLFYRLIADSTGDDLIFHDLTAVGREIENEILKVRNLEQSRADTFTRSFFSRLTQRPGTILHIDGDNEFLNRCLSFYRKAGIKCIGKAVNEENQPGIIGRYLQLYGPDIVIITGHDGIKKGAGGSMSLEGYRNSKYFAMSAEIARKFQPDFDKLCIFSGACQSYFEAIMNSGANFASSPGRILINYLDPAIVGKSVALTDSRAVVTPREIGEATVSGNRGIGGINTKGRMLTLR